MAWNLMLAVYLIAIVGMAIFGVNSGWMLVRSQWARLAARRAKPAPPTPLQPESEWPFVTVQLPIFNERYVAERIVRAAAALEWPRDRLQIQVLDDSTDDTADLTASVVRELRDAGIDIEHRHRTDRRGYKAGALAAAMPHVKGEFIALFDADFVPATDWLHRILIEQHAFADPRTGFAQTRWTYLNREHSLVTRAQAMMHDVHFLVEQEVRCRDGLWFNFNGSGGLWRRTCIDDAGGWQIDTLTEDLDLSYRAALRGWRGEYRSGIHAPNELPERILAFKKQQARWARGSIQTARKMLGPVLRSDAGLFTKFCATVHLCGYSMHALLISFLILWPLICAGVTNAPTNNIPLWANLLSPTSLGFILGFPIVQLSRGRDWRKIFPELLLTVVIGVGVSAANSIAVIRGLFGKDPGEFVRTPKSGDVSRGSRYRIQLDATVVFELAMMTWLTTWAIVLWHNNAPLWSLACAFYAACFAHFILGQAWEIRLDRPRAQPVVAEDACSAANS